MNEQRSSMGNRQQQHRMDARQLGRRMGSQQLWNGMGHQRQRPMSRMQQPGRQPQNRIHAQNGVGRPQCYGFIEYSPISNKTQALIVNNNFKSSAPPAHASPSTTLPKTLMVPYARVQQAPDPSDHSFNILNNDHKPHLAARRSVNLVTGLIDLQQRRHERQVQRLHFQLDVQVF